MLSAWQPVSDLFRICGGLWKYVTVELLSRLDPKNGSASNYYSSWKWYAISSGIWLPVIAIMYGALGGKYAILTGIIFGVVWGVLVAFGLMEGERKRRSGTQQPVNTWKPFSSYVGVVGVCVIPAFLFAAPGLMASWVSGDKRFALIGIVVATGMTAESLLATHSRMVEGRKDRQLPQGRAREFDPDAGQLEPTSGTITWRRTTGKAGGDGRAGGPLEGDEPDGAD